MRNKTSTKKAGIIWVGLFVSLVILSGIAYSEKSENSKSRFSFKLTSGLSYMSLGEINESLNTQGDLGRRAEKFWDVEFSFVDEIKKINYGINFEGELRMDISSRFAIGLSIGYIHAKRESYSILRGEDRSRTYTSRSSYEQIVNIIPVKLGIYYRLPLFPRTALLLNVGGGYYFTKSSLYSDQHRVSRWFDDRSLESSWTEHTKYVNGDNFGYHGGIGFEYSLGNNLSIIIEWQERHVRIKELKGKDIMVTSDGDKMKTYGTLWYHNFESDGKYYTNLVLRDIRLEPYKPTQTVREAVFDLSGYSLRVGIIIKL